MIIVTGGAGFIGSNIVQGLNQLGRTDIYVVDDLKDGRKFHNLVKSQIADYLDKEDFLQKIKTNQEFDAKIEAVFHQGACTTTTEWNGRYMLQENYEFSKILLHYCLKRRIPFIYASSAAIYGASKNFQELPENELPLNVYGFSKLLFDRYVEQVLPQAKSQIVGLRYFNVYGPNEQHKNAMASVIYHFSEQLKKENKIKLFGAYDGYQAGEQRRDFVYVQDAVAVNLWFWQNAEQSGIYNLGTGQSRTFNEVAGQVIALAKRGTIEYIPFPEHLMSAYQSYTQADLTALRQAGFKEKFKTIEEGIKRYLANN